MIYVYLVESMEDGKNSMKYTDLHVLYEDNHLIVVEKPVNIPVMEDSSQDQDLLSVIKEYLKVKYNKPGNVYVGLVHRLDRPVGGVMVFAKTSKAASRLSDQVRTNTIQKTYRAIVCGHPKKQDTFKDYMVKNSKTNTSYVTNKDQKDAKYAELSYHVISTHEELTQVEIQLKTGRSHQIRVQFSSRGYPLWGDQRYNKNAKVGQKIALFAYQLQFQHPTTKEELTFTLQTPQEYPWNL